MGTRRAQITLTCAGCRYEESGAVRNTGHGKHSPAYVRHFDREGERLVAARGWVRAGERLYCPRCKSGLLTLPAGYTSP